MASITPAMTPATRLIATGKLRAFLIHVIASALVVGSIGALMWYLWFPQPWFMHDGGWQVYQLILLVDVILGPLLTLIVYRQGKPGMQRDITIIVAVQLGALAFGTGTMYQYRPAFIVYGDSNFFSVTLNEVRRNTRDLGRLERFVPDRGPGIVILRPPSAPKDQSLFRALRSTDGTAIVSRGDYYDTLTDADWNALFARGPRIEDLARLDPAIAADLERFRKRNTAPMETLGFVPVVCRREIIMLVFDRKTHTIVDWLD